MSMMRSSNCTRSVSGCTTTNTSISDSDVAASRASDPNSRTSSMLLDNPCRSRLTNSSTASRLFEAEAMIVVWLPAGLVQGDAASTTRVIAGPERRYTYAQPWACHENPIVARCELGSSHDPGPDLLDKRVARGHPRPWPERLRREVGTVGRSDG